MKVFLIFFIATLSFAVPTLAAEDKGHGTADGHNTAPSPIVHRENSSLFPPKKADPSKSTPPATPKLVAPKFQEELAAGDVTLKWEDVPTASVYHVQVATDPNFKWLKIDDHSVRATTLDVKGLEKGRLYFWRVAGWKNDNMAATSHGQFAVSTFEVK